MVDYLSTDYRNGGTEHCGLLMRKILDSPRLVIIPHHPENVEVLPTLIVKDQFDGKVALFEISYQGGGYAALRNAVRPQLVITPIGDNDDRYIYEFRTQEERHNVFSALSLSYVRDVGSAR